MFKKLKLKQTNKMKFTAQILKKAWSLFKSGVPTWGESLRQAIKIDKAIKSKTVTFWKMPKNQNDEVEITTRNIATIEEIGLTLKGAVNSAKKSLVQKFVDLDKYLNGDTNCIISFNSFQII